MDAVKFLWERARMCGHGCKNCPTSDDKCDIYTPDCDYESLVKAVEVWAADHPRKTRQDVFLEQWPDALTYADGVLSICPNRVANWHRGAVGECIDGAQMCADCRREFWMEEVE